MKHIVKRNGKKNVENICSSSGFLDLGKTPIIVIGFRLSLSFLMNRAFLYDSKEQLRNMGYRVDLFGSSIVSSLLRKV